MGWLNGYGNGAVQVTNYGCHYAERTSLPWNKSAPLATCCKIVRCRNPEAVCDPKRLGQKTAIHARPATSDDYFGEVIKADYCIVRSGYCNKKTCLLYTPKETK